MLFHNYCIICVLLIFNTLSIALILPSKFIVHSYDGILSKSLLTSQRDVPLSSTEVDSVESEKQIRKICWSASAQSSFKVKEINRSCEEYMALPASQYSVLSADQVERISESQFKYKLGNLNFFGTIICPVLYVDVNVYPELAKSEIIVKRAETVGSDVAEQINGSFSVSALNTVYAGKDKKGRKTLCSDANLKVEVNVPESKFPLRVIQSGGNFIIQSTLSVLVTAFVRILAADFSRWSAGDDNRSAVDGAKLTA